MDDQKRNVLGKFIESRKPLLPRPARRFLEELLKDDELLSRMHFCTPEDRRRLRNSVLICTEEVPCWAVLLGNEPDAPSSRVRLALEGLNLSARQVLERLRGLPVWFLAVDSDLVAPTPGDAPRMEQTIYRLADASVFRLRRLALLDQVDAALDAGDRKAFKRLSRLLNDE